MLRLLLAALLVAPAASAQVGFSLSNNRNHPELRWVVAATEHFEIVYPERLAGIEAQVAPVAEATFDAVTANLGDGAPVRFDDPIRVYLSDEDEIANGFAVNVGASGFTNIWVPRQRRRQRVLGRRAVAPQGRRARDHAPYPLPRDALAHRPARNLLRRPVPALLDRGLGAVRDRALTAAKRFMTEAEMAARSASPPRPSPTVVGRKKGAPRKADAADADAPGSSAPTAGASGEETIAQVNSDGIAPDNQPQPTAADTDEAVAMNPTSRTTPAGRPTWRSSGKSRKVEQ